MRCEFTLSLYLNMPSRIAEFVRGGYEAGGYEMIKITKRSLGVFLIAFLSGCFIPLTAPAEGLFPESAAQGSWVDSRAYVSLAAATVSPDTAGKTILVSTPTSITTNVTVPFDRTLAISRGGKVTVPSGATLSIQCPFEAGLYRVFDGGGKVTFGASSVKEVSPQWWGAAADGVADDTDALQRAFDTQKSVGMVGFYRFSRTLVPKHNRQIRFYSDSKLIADRKGTYAEMVQYPSAATGLHILFDVSQLGTPVPESSNRQGSIVENLTIDATGVPNSVGIGPAVEWFGNESEATNPINTFIRPTVQGATWGYYANSAIGKGNIGGFTGSSFINPSARSCANGMFLGANQDDITVINLRVTSSTGVSLRVKGLNKNVVSAFLRPEAGVGLLLDPGTLANHFGALFIEASNPSIAATDYPVKLNGSSSGVDSAAHLSVAALTINYPDGSAASPRKWIFVNGRHDTVDIGALHFDQPLSHACHLWLEYGTGVAQESTHRIRWMNTWSSFVPGFNYAGAGYQFEARWWTKIELFATDRSGIYHGKNFVPHGRNPLSLHRYASATGDTVYLDGFGMGGVAYKNTSRKLQRVSLHPPLRPPVDGDFFHFMNAVDSGAAVELNAGSTLVVKRGAEFLAPGEIATIIYRSVDNKWVQVGRM